MDQAESKLEFVFGIDICVTPRHMILNIEGKVPGYRNEIVVATADLTMGKNENINAQITPSDHSNDTGEKGVVVLQPQTLLENPT